ncbi:unnamed protein product, partial [Brugia timori]|uniref:Ovule protein n=1 Tax=Brugia timori TaxID=42155 RepID=A0A0R3Q8B5_9BILA
LTGDGVYSTVVATDCHCHFIFISKIIFNGDLTELHDSFSNFKFICPKFQLKL